MTPSDFQKRFPAFASVDAPEIQRAINSAVRKVGGNWTVEDREEGQFLYAAHVLTLDGFGTGAEAQSYAEGTAGLKNISSGSLSLTRFDRNNLGDVGGGLKSTIYGQRFSELLALNIGSAARTGSR